MIPFTTRFVFCVCFILLTTHLVQAGEPVTPAATSDLSARKDTSKLSHLQGDKLLFTVYCDAGVFDLYLGDRLLEDGRVFVNGESTLDGAEFKSKRGKGLTAEKTLGDLEVKTSFAVHDEKWLGITLTIVNRGENNCALTDLRFLECGSSSLFRSEDRSAQRFFSDSLNSPSGMPSSVSVEKNEISGYNVGILMLPSEPEVWSIAWRSTQVWSNRINVSGSPLVLSAAVDLKYTPYTIKPGETVTFDECLVSGSYSFTDSLLALRSFVEERKITQRAEISHGFVLNKELDSTLDEKKALEVALAVSRWREGAPFVGNFILADGWFRDVGRWSFHDGFEVGKDSWVRQITRMNALPGVQLSPFRMGGALRKENNYSRLTFTPEAQSAPAVAKQEAPVAAAEAAAPKEAPATTESAAAVNDDAKTEAAPVVAEAPAAGAALPPQVAPAAEAPSATAEVPVTTAEAATPKEAPATTEAATAVKDDVKTAAAPVVAAAPAACAALPPQVAPAVETPAATAEVPVTTAEAAAPKESPATTEAATAVKDDVKTAAAPVVAAAPAAGVALPPQGTPPAEASAAAAEEEDSTDTGTNAVLCDPTEPVFMKQLCEQIEDLRKQGVRCFETQGLFSDSLLKTPYPAFKTSGVTSRASLRSVYEAMRDAMGSDTLWISDEPVTAATAGLVDVFLVAPEAPRRWHDVQGVVKRSAGRFWMNGSPWRVCQGHLRLAETVLSGEAKDGFTYDEARSWCTYLVMTGGPVYWSDDPARTAPEILTLVARTFKHSGGATGVPLDLDRNDLPNLWIRQEKDSTYIALFNWSDAPRELSISYRQEKALARIVLLTDILTGETQRVETGVLKMTLRPHQSFCAQIPRQNKLF